MSRALCSSNGGTEFVSPMKSLYSFLLILPVFAIAAPYEEDTVVRIGDDAPEFSVETTEGDIFSTKELEGKIILVNLFATWCGPCRAEMPHLQKGLYEKFKDNENFAVIALAREENNDVVSSFAKSMDLTFPVAGDSDRSIYSKFAEGYIPRNYLIGKDGKIIYGSVGYEPAEFEELIELIASELNEEE